jgi:predicted DsbA family dithiol-disulfide isomerase
MIEVQPGTVVVFSDIGCPWAHAAVSRLHRTRGRLGLDDEVRFEHRAFPLELVNERPTPKRTLEAEIPVVGAIEPDAGWQLWKGPDFEYPVSTLLALEAVQAAQQQSLHAGEELDRALRVAFFGQSRCISMRHVVLDVAGACDQVDVDALSAALDNGAARHRVFEHRNQARGDDVKGSPHLFAPGLDAHNPGVTMHWEGDEPGGYPVVDGDDPSVYDRLLVAASSSASSS